MTDSEDSWLHSIAMYENPSALREMWKPLPEAEYSFETFLNLLGVAPLVLATFWFQRLRLFHRNLTKIVVDLMAAYLVRSVLRLAVCVVVLVQLRVCEECEGELHVYKPLLIKHLDVLCSVCQYVCSINMLLIFGERAVATRWARCYETATHDGLMFAIFFAKWTVTAIAMYICALGYINVLVLAGVAAGIVTSSGVGLVFLLHLNYRAYKDKVQIGTGLSYRYQISENVRAVQMLLPTLTLLLLGCVVTMFIYIGSLFAETVYVKALLGLFFNLIVAGGSIVLPLVCMLSHRNLRHTIVSSVRKRWRRRKQRVVSVSGAPSVTHTCATMPPPVAVSLNGEKLILDTDQTTTVYFKQLSQMWN